MITRDYIVGELGHLIADEKLLEKLLERASRNPRDPREVAFLWNLATECRDHARILSRHLRDRDGGKGLVKQSGRRRRPRAAEGPPILNPVSLYAAFDEAFRSAERAIIFHRRGTDWSRFWWRR